MVNVKGWFTVRLRDKVSFSVSVTFKVTVGLGLRIGL